MSQDSSNPDTNPGGFHGRVHPSEPMEKHGHQIGQHASPTDNIPTFSAQTLPAGTAPKESTYQPNPAPENMGGMYQSATTTLTGSDSATTHTGLGHPGQGMTSTELRHDGQHGRKKEGLGLAGLAGMEGMEGMGGRGKGDVK